MSVFHWLFGKHPPRAPSPQRAVGLDLLPHWQAELVVAELASLGIRATISDHQVKLSRNGELAAGAQIWVMETDADLARRVVNEMESADAPQFVLRPTAATDDELLVDALAEAIWTDEPDTPKPDVTDDPRLFAYIDHFGERPGDEGWIAEDLDGMPIGAAWCRLFPTTAPGYGFVAADIPELAVAVAPRWRNQGVGSALLVALLDGHDAMSLSVHRDNPARRLYERFRFTQVERSGDAITMVRVGHD